MKVTIQHLWNEQQIQTTFRSSPDIDNSFISNRQQRHFYANGKKALWSADAFNSMNLLFILNGLPENSVKFVSVRCNFASLPKKAKIRFGEKTFWFSLLIMFFESSRDWWIRSSRPSTRELIRFAFRVPLSNEQSFSMVPLPMGRRSFSSRQKQNEQHIKQSFPCKQNDHFDSLENKQSYKRATRAYIRLFTEIGAKNLFQEHSVK